jgi:hypothetical protein
MYTDSFSNTPVYNGSSGLSDLGWYRPFSSGYG